MEEEKAVGLSVDQIGFAALGKFFAPLLQGLHSPNELFGGKDVADRLADMSDATQPLDSSLRAAYKVCQAIFDRLDEKDQRTLYVQNVHHLQNPPMWKADAFEWFRTLVLAFTEMKEPRLLKVTVGKIQSRAASLQHLPEALMEGDVVVVTAKEVIANTYMKIGGNADLAWRMYLEQWRGLAPEGKHRERLAAGLRGLAWICYLQCEREEEEIDRNTRDEMMSSLCQLCVDVETYHRTDEAACISCLQDTVSMDDGTIDGWVKAGVGIIELAHAIMGEVGYDKHAYVSFLIAGAAILLMLKDNAEGSKQRVQEFIEHFERMQTKFEGNNTQKESMISRVKIARLR